MAVLVKEPVLVVVAVVAAQLVVENALANAMAHVVHLATAGHADYWNYGTGKP